MRFTPLPFGPPIGWRPLKYLLDVGFTRDVRRPPDRYLPRDGPAGGPQAGPRRPAGRRHRRRMGAAPPACRSTWCLTGHPAAPSAMAVTASTSRSTPSTSSARWPAAGEAAARRPVYRCYPSSPPHRHHHITTRRKIMATVIMQTWDGITPGQYAGGR